jgi:hypothetical protein
VQIFATTHSDEMIRAAVDGIPANLAGELSGIRLSKKGQETVAKQYSGEALRAALESDLEVR